MLEEMNKENIPITTMPEDAVIACKVHLDKLLLYVGDNDLKNGVKAYIDLMQSIDSAQSLLTTTPGNEEILSQLDRIRVRANAISEKHFPWGERKRETGFSVRENLNIDFHLVDHCNLSCQCCSHYSCIAKERYVTMEELTYALHYANKIHPTYFNLLGGEPLLHPEIDEMLALAGERLDTDINARLFTNGLLLEKMSDDFWSNLRRYNIGLSLSNYPLSVDYAGLVALADKRGVNAALVFSGACCFRKTLLSPEGKRDGEKSYSSCKGRLQIRDGRLYPCQYSAYIDALNERFQTAFHHTEGDYLVLDEKTTKECVGMGAVCKAFLPVL